MHSHDNVTVRLNGVLLLRTSGKASLYRINNGEQYFFPESVIQEKNPAAGYIKVEKWFLDKKGIHYAA